MTSSLTLTALSGIPEVTQGDNVAALIRTALAAENVTLQAGDVIAIAQKIISKAEGRMVNLDDVVVSAEAATLAAETDKDPRLVELMLRESDEVSRQRKGVIIVRHTLGFVSANAGIDRSNVKQAASGEWVLLLPEDPDASAETIRQSLQAQFGVDVGVVITDSHGRPHRLGTVGVCIGAAGLPALLDKRGESDRYGYKLRYTEIGVADEIAAAASLLMGQAAESRPVILLRGLSFVENAGRSADLYRPKEFDLYR